MPGLRGTIGPLPKGWSVSGGTITTPMVNGIAMKVHTFTATGSSTLTVNGPLGLVDTTEDYQATLPIQYLILAGGGGGGNANNSGAAGGGGGAGGLRCGTASLTIGAYTIVVGAGGAGGAQGFNNGSNGGDSSAFGITATGGGGGGYSSTGGAGGAGSIGGNGGGGGNSASGGAATATTPTQGVAGQAGNAGLGGFGGSLGITTYPPNTDNTTYIPLGTPNSISGTTVIYAKGGYPSGSNQSNRSANTGDGGMANVGGTTAYAGGSGVVIISYLV